MDSIEPSQVFSQSSRRQRTPLLPAAATGSLSLVRCVGGILLRALCLSAYLSLYLACPCTLL